MMWVKCDTVLPAVSPATMQAHKLAEGKVWSFQLGGLDRQWSHFSGAEGTNLKHQLQQPHLTLQPRLSKGKNTIQVAGWTEPTVILLLQGWELQPREPSTQTVPDPPTKPVVT